MARPAKGTVEHRPAKGTEPAGWWGKCTDANGRRTPWMRLGDWPNSAQGRARAEETCAAFSERLRERGIVTVPQRGPAARVEKAKAAGDETVADYAKRWLDDRERRGLASIANDRTRMRLHVLPSLVDRTIVGLTRDDVRGVVESLDDRVRKAELSWKTAGRAWGLVTKMCADSCESKVSALRVRSENPALGVRGPDRGIAKAKQWLYPSEIAALVACAEVPLRWRRLYTLAAYLYLRPGELAALEWADVQLEHGYVSVHQSLDIRLDESKPTKTKTTRRVPIHATLAPLLTAMRAETGGVGRVIQHTHDNKKVGHGMPPVEDLAATLREHLGRAGVTRAELFADRPTTKRVTFYDLRATGITWEVLSGTEHVRIMQRAGHAAFNTTLGYVREAEALGVSAGEPFGPLPASLLSPPEPATGRVSFNRFVLPGRLTHRSSRNSAGSVSVPKGIRNVADRQRTRRIRGDSAQDRGLVR